MAAKTAGKGRKRTPPERAKFIAALGEAGMVKAAAKAAGVARTTPYLWRNADAKFAKAWDAAMDLGLDAMEDEAKRRGMLGVTRKIYYQGKVCGSQQEFSDNLLMFMLKGRRPEVFKDRMALEHESTEAKIARLNRGKERVEDGARTSTGT